MFCWKVSSLTKSRYDIMFLFTVMYKLKVFFLAVNCSYITLYNLYNVTVFQTLVSDGFFRIWFSIFRKESSSLRFSFRSMVGQFNNLISIKFSMVDINLFVLNRFSKRNWRFHLRFLYKSSLVISENVPDRFFGEWTQNFDFCE